MGNVILATIVICLGVFVIYFHKHMLPKIKEKRKQKEISEFFYKNFQ